MTDEISELVIIVIIGGSIGLIIGLILRVFFKGWTESFKKGTEGLGWIWFFLFCIFFLAMTLYSWAEGSNYIAIVFFAFAVLEFAVMLQKYSLKK